MEELQTADRIRVSVIGGGIVGVCTALWLQREGCSVTLVEANEIGLGSSYGNAGCFNASSVVPVSTPGIIWNVPGYLLDPMGPLVIRPRYIPKITPWLVRFLLAGTSGRVDRQAAALGPLLRDSIGSYSPLIQGTPAAELVRHEGHLIVYRKKGDFEKDALAWRLRRENGIVWEELRGQELREFEPALTDEADVGLSLPQNGHTVNPLAFVTALADNFRAGGGKIVRAKATGFELADNRLVAVETTSGRIPCDRAVIACGAHSRKLAAQLGEKIPLDTERGYHIVIRDPEVMPRIPITDASGRFVASPMDMGLRIAGTVEFAGLQAAPDMTRARQLIAHGKRLFPGLKDTYSDDRLSEWMGFRPSMPDSLPVIGPSRKTPDVVLAFGHGHVGMASGARTGALVRDMLLDRPHTIPSRPFSPRRFDLFGGNR
ncbi:MAG: FAD-dependent oxidoreductase [Rhizobiales bacterium]|nr:FAD-dependent oxidoreductase [Hyphomicrobiales bacterium]MBA70685.1 FAD-dependent oxidoreductase [Hyphomicrobiales bacterium]|tara:strand:- start:244 stop:1536 length:1293 start_codon:yes stop_codon:yes gene_type:complete